MPPTAAFLDRYQLTPGLQSPAAAGTVTPDLSMGLVWKIQMPAGNITVANPMNAYPGDELTLIIIQDGVGTRTVTWGSLYKKLVTLSTLANARDTVSFKFDGTDWSQVGSALAIL